LELIRVDENMIYVILISCFLIRALPRLWVRHAYVSDTYYHLYCSQVIRENWYRLPKKLPRVVLNHVYTYPFGYHYLLALFPYPYRLWFERLTGAIFDTLSGLIIYWFLTWVIRERYLTSSADLPIFVTALYAFSPALLRIPWGPRSYHGSPRVMGETLYLLHITSAYFSLVSKSLPGLIVSLLSGALLIVTAKFGTQVLLFLGIFFSIFLCPSYALLILGCFVTGVILTRGLARRIIMGHIRHSVFYFKYIQQVFIWPQLKTIKDYLRSFRENLTNTVSFGKWWRLIQWYYAERYFLHLLITVYPQFLFFLFWFCRWERMVPFEQFLMVWMGAGLFWFFMTSLKWTLFMGEGDRYLEYALVPSLVLLVHNFMPSYKSLIYGLLVYSLGSALYYIGVFLFVHRRDDREFEITETVLKKFNEFPQGVIWPIGPFHYQALVQTRFPVLSHGGNMDARLLPLHEFMLVYGNYPYPSEHFTEIVNRYQVSYIMSAPAFLKHYREKIIKRTEDLDRSVEILWETPALLIGRIIR
jgi:hypothetical protein